MIISSESDITLFAVNYKEKRLFQRHFFCMPAGFLLLHPPSGLKSVLFQLVGVKWFSLVPTLLKHSSVLY